MIKKILMLNIILMMNINATEKMPIKAKPGQCFTKGFYPPKYTKTTKIKSRKKVLLNDQSVKYEVIPAKYSVYEEKIKISDGTEKIVTTPAVFKTVYERVLVEPAKKIWRKNLDNKGEEAFHSCVQAAANSGMNIQNSKVGTCFYEHYQAETYGQTTSKILASEASERMIVTAAKYATTSKKILTDNTSVKLLPSMAVYKKVKDKVVVEPARTEWKKTICNDRGCNQSEVVCLVETPATYKNVTKKIVLQPAVSKSVAVNPVYKTINVKKMIKAPTVQSIPIPAQYKTISQKNKLEEAKYYWTDASSKNERTRIRSQCNKICLTEVPAKYKKVAKQVLVSPASSKKVTTPAKYKQVKVRKVIKDASFKKVVIPAEYITVRTERERTKGYAKWTPMICEEMLTPNIIKKVQRALQLHGFYNGPIDGVWNIKSKSSARAYQKEKGLAMTHKLSIETMKSLGIY